MPADDSFSSSDESCSSTSPVPVSRPRTKPSDGDDDNDDLDLFPPVTARRSRYLSSRQRRQRFWLACKAYFAMTFLVVALLSLFVHFFQHLVRHPSGSVAGAAAPSQSRYEIELDEQSRYRLSWSVDYEARAVLFELQLEQLNSSNAWFGLGFSEQGSLANTDWCVTWWDRKRHRIQLQDARTGNDTVLATKTERRQAACRLLAAKRQPTHRRLRLAWRRKWDTCHTGDYIIDNGTTLLVWATGSGPVTRLDGLDVAASSQQHGLQPVQLLKPASLWRDQSIPSESVLTVDFLAPNVSVPSAETTYWCHLGQVPAGWLRRPVHVVQYEAVVAPASSRHLVHHMELFHCELDVLTRPEPWNGPCSDPHMPPELQQCRRVVAAWAHGAGPLRYPAEVGLAVGGSNYSRFVMLEVHYNNPGLRADLVDRSGLRLHYTEQLRRYEAGIMEVGLEYSAKNSIPPGVVMELRGYCVSECSRAGLPHPITIFASQLHTHLSGVAAWTEHVRAEARLPDINRDMHYSPHFQEIRRLEPPVRFEPGDAMVQVCRYDTTARSRITLGGLAISEEMCVSYLHYYPRTELEVCKSSIDTEHLYEFFDSARELYGQNTSREWPVPVNLRNIAWTPGWAARLDQLYRSAPLSVQCNRSSGHRFPGHWNAIPLTTVPGTGHQQAAPRPCRWVLADPDEDDDDDDDGDEDEPEDRRWTN